MRHYDELVGLVRTYNLGPDNPSDYDFNGVVHLMLAALDNLREHALEAELEDICYSMDDRQREFLQRVAKFAARLRDEQIRSENDRNDRGGHT